MKVQTEEPSTWILAVRGATRLSTGCLRTHFLLNLNIINQRFIIHIFLTSLYKSQASMFEWVTSGICAANKIWRCGK